MINKEIKNKIMDNVKDKEDKIFISNLLDKILRFEKTDTLCFTNFLNLKELNIAKKILDYLKVNYTIFCANDSLEKKNIFFIPKYLENSKEIFSDNIACLKIIPNVSKKIIHKDYMGAIYSLGIKRDQIGDIVVFDDFAYVFCMRNMKEYLGLNLTTVGRQDVCIKEVDIFSTEISNISFKFIEKEIIVASFRVDAMLSEIYGLSRLKAKDKIVRGDLFINDINIFYPNTILKEGDIVSFKKCGKVKIGEEIRKTKSENIVLKVYIYS